MPALLSAHFRIAPGVISREVDGEFVVIDTMRGQAHSLTGLTAQVWRAIGSTLALDASASDVDVATTCLLELHLIEAIGLTRRAVLTRGGGLIAAVGIVSIALPEASAAASPMYTYSNTTAGSYTATTFPTGLTTIYFTITGAGGATHSGVGGSGAAMSGKITGALGGVTITGIVGAGGVQFNSNGTGGAGGAGDGNGGAGGSGDANGGGGGTSLKTGSSYLVVAGGGGGGGTGYVVAGLGGGGSGGAGGTTGGTGTTGVNPPGGAGGTGATASAVGTGGAGTGATTNSNGSNGSGSNGGAGGGSSTGTTDGGGGGGGGYYGGGGGGRGYTAGVGSGGGGGGGSNYSGGSAGFTVTVTTSSTAGNGGAVNGTTGGNDGGAGSVSLHYP